MKATLTAFPSRGSSFHCFHKQRRGRVVEHPLATQTTRVRTPLRPKRPGFGPQDFFIIYLFYLHRSRFFGHAKMMIFRSQPTTPTPTPTPEFLRNELFNAIVLKLIESERIPAYHGLWYVSVLHRRNPGTPKTGNDSFTADFNTKVFYAGVHNDFHDVFPSRKTPAK